MPLHNLERPSYSGINVAYGVIKMPLLKFLLKLILSSDIGFA